MTEILHVSTPEAWDRTLAAGAYRADSLASEGFIHCSTRAQLPGVVERYYRGRTGLIVLRIDADKVMPALRWEAPKSMPDERFPHIYGPLNTEAVVEVVPLEIMLKGG